MADESSLGSALARLRWDKTRVAQPSDGTLGSRIRAARLRRGWTLEQLGVLVGAERAQIWKYETNRQIPRETRLGQLVDALGEEILDEGPG